MSTITTRAGKGSPLTNTELDSNFTNLNTDKIENVVEDTTPQLGGDLDVNGHLVAGRNIATDGTKLDGIEAGADVTDTANVTAAGALMDSELTDITAVKALDQGVATTDSVTHTGLDLSAISSSIADTAVDVFVYDTRKDSDGGAWRKRTQHTSWYNEPLNTSTRGARKEFPAVAVIVATGTSVTIYDGDDPTLPMWMVFNKQGNWKGSWLGRTGTPVTSVAMLNGEIVITCNNGSTAYAEDTQQYNFIKDSGFYHLVGGKYLFNSFIADRNIAFTTTDITSDGMVAYKANDCAMTVLPNAPIDPATQLPIPTIAVATDGGVSVIKDDGSVVDITATSGHEAVAFGNDKLYIQRIAGPYLEFGGIPNADSTSSLWRDNYYTAEALSPCMFAGSEKEIAIGEYIASIGDNFGSLTLIDENTSDYFSGMYTSVSSTYNTGWMNGDIKLATLSDTDTTNVTGSNLLTGDNANFTTTVGDWTATGGTITASSGRLRVTDTSGIYGYGVSPSMTVEVGKTYTISLELVGGTAGLNYVQIGTTAQYNYYSNVFIGNTPQTCTYTFVATNTDLCIRLASGTSINAYSDWDNVSVRLAEEDRSVNGNGLQVFGTVTKNPVATGADLVAYSGTSSSNYLSQPYNSDLDFTDTMCVSLWMKNLQSSDNVFDRGTRYVDQSYGLYADAGNDLRFYYSTNGTTDRSIEIADGQLLFAGGWAHLIISINAGNVAMYVNGESKTLSSTQLVGNFYSQATAKNPLKVGTGTVNGASNSFSFALFRISGTPVTAEQARKIYEDEKVLFQEGAQATLYGSSDAVTALAYDDTTDLLHVGTSAGRSDFSGLRRVSNTTDAVGTAISASNGLIAEE